MSAFVENPYTSESSFNYIDFAEAVKIAVKGLNEVLDEGISLHPLKEQRESVYNWRQIGLGIMGLADTLIKLRIKYGDEESLNFIDAIGSVMATSAITESNLLAKEYGSYPKYTNKVLDSQFLKQHVTPTLLYNRLDEIKKYGLRNSQLLTCAPTGSIATMLGISNGIEPLFAKSWERKTESLHGEDVYYTERPKVIAEYMFTNNISSDKELPNFIVTAHRISPYKRIDVQSTLQKHIDASISSTINLPNNATIEQVGDIYRYAWISNLKGVTIYRDGCKRSGILTTNENKEEKEVNENNKPKRGEVIKVNDQDAIGFKRKLMTGCGSLHCTAYFDVNSGNLVETYLSKGSTGGCNNFMIGLSRMISMAARGGIPIQDIVDQLMSTGACPSYAVRTATKHDTSKGSCCPMAVGYALKEMWEEFQGKEMKPKEQKAEPQIETIYARKNDKPVASFTYVKCPECGEPLTFEGGCNICKGCGWSKCD